MEEGHSATLTLISARGEGQLPVFWKLSAQLNFLGGASSIEAAGPESWQTPPSWSQPCQLLET